ncbi:alpha/beta fold hydrolase [Frankia sp. AiPs1]|uniref:alpha/beta fold hydrolase n=1 Tax=Frankia sp. AiPs1 TaxID=573493 RepID=UPI002044C1E5|nr:alpha/beta hydrolase [Frankia sp. AiPs1]MCM3923492.1 alpha/beta fold hydrolase [Frankia sp. AiPs1]
MVSASGWRLPVAAGLELHVEDVRPDARPPGATALAGITHAGIAHAEIGVPPAEGGGPGAAGVGAGDRDRPVVLVHGIAGSTADWSAVAPELAASRRVIAYDHRGHGASGRAPGGRAGYTFDLLLADLAAVIAALGPAEVDLVGHSLGGVIALRYTLEHPDRVRSLLLVDTAAAPATPTGPVARRILAAVLEGAAAIMSGTGVAQRDGRAGGDGDGADGDGPVGAAQGDSSEAAAPDGGGLGAVHDHRNPAERQMAGLGQTDPEALAALGRELGCYPSLVPRLGEITAPTTVIVGEHDSTLRAGAQTLAHDIRGTHLAVIAGADHSPQASRPLAWLAAVDAHFARVETAAAGGISAGGDSVGGTPAGGTPAG